MFADAKAFNQDLLDGIPQAYRVLYMFDGVTSFDQNLCNWKDSPAVATSSVCFICSMVQHHLRMADTSFEACQCGVSF